MTQRHALELTDWPHRVEVSENQKLRGTVAEARAQVIASGLTGDSFDDRAGIPQAARELVPTPINRGLVSRRRLQGSQGHRRLDQPLPLALTKLEEVFQMHHVPI